MKIICSNTDTLPRGIDRGYVVQPAEEKPEWDTIPKRGAPWVMLDREEGGANVLYAADWVKLSCVAVSNAVMQLRTDIKTARKANPLARVGCWSVPGTEDIDDFTLREIVNRFAWPVVARCDFCLLNGYIYYPTDAAYWITGCAKIVRAEFNKPIVYGVQPLYAGGDHYLEVIAEDRFAQHIRDVKASGADAVWYWGAYRRLLNVGRARLEPRNDFDKAIFAAFDKHHPDKQGWTFEELAAWCAQLDSRCLKIAKGVCA